MNDLVEIIKETEDGSYERVEYNHVQLRNSWVTAWGNEDGATKPKHFPTDKIISVEGEVDFQK